MKPPTEKDVERLLNAYGEGPSCRILEILRASAAKTLATLDTDDAHTERALKHLILSDIALTLRAISISLDEIGS